MKKQIYKKSINPNSPKYTKALSKKMKDMMRPKAPVATSRG